MPFTVTPSARTIWTRASLFSTHLFDDFVSPEHHYIMERERLLLQCVMVGDSTVHVALYFQYARHAFRTSRIPYEVYYRSTQLCVLPCTRVRGISNSHPHLRRARQNASINTSLIKHHRRSRHGRSANFGADAQHSQRCQGHMHALTRMKQATILAEGYMIDSRRAIIHSARKMMQEGPCMKWRKGSRGVDVHMFFEC